VNRQIITYSRTNAAAASLQAHYSVRKRTISDYTDNDDGAASNFPETPGNLRFGNLVLPPLNRPFNARN
jgi:hypothetical protein